MAEALGMTIPCSAGIPAPDARLLSMSHATGRDMVTQGRTPSPIMTKDSLLNATIAIAAVGGPAKPVVHKLAIAGRLGVNLRLNDFAGAGVPFMANLQSRSQNPASEAAYAGPVRGWAKLYVDHVMQADPGADLDFLVGASGDEVGRESH